MLMKPPPKKPVRTNQAAGDRLQKVLAAAGFGSRRDCEELILQGRVEVDRVVAQLGTRADLEAQEVRVDGIPLRQTKRRYFMVNKPGGVLSTARDPWGRARVIDLIDSQDRLFTVGRLDQSSTGLILLTNDGDLANQLAHPRFGVPKIYHVVVAGNPTAETLQKLRQGIYLAEGLVKVNSVHVTRQLKQSAQLEIVLTEGRNREIRRILAKVGHKVMRLKRVAIGPLRLGDLPLGAHRELKRNEVQLLRDAAAGLPTKKSRRPKSRRAPAKLDHQSTDAPSPRAKVNVKPVRLGKKSGASRSPAESLFTAGHAGKRGGSVTSGRGGRGPQELPIAGMGSVLGDEEFEVLPRPKKKGPGERNPRSSAGGSTGQGRGGKRRGVASSSGKSGKSGSKVGKVASHGGKSRSTTKFRAAKAARVGKGAKQAGRVGTPSQKKR
jgi:23S rRNA pseudouridine2605 synthase